RGYIVRSDRILEATEKGMRLIEVVHPEVKSPSMTGQWEAYLQRIQHGGAQLNPFLAGIEKYVQEVISQIGQGPRTQPIAATGQEDYPNEAPSLSIPVRRPTNGDGKTPTELLTSAFGFASFRP